MPRAAHLMRVLACMCVGTAGPRSVGLRRPGVAVSTTGVGEAIMRTGLARRLGEALALPQTLSPGGAPPGAAAARVLLEDVLLGQPAALPAPPVDCGALALRVVLHPASLSACSETDAADPDPGSAVAGQAGLLARSHAAHAARASKPSDPDPSPGAASGRSCSSSARRAPCAQASPAQPPAKLDPSCSGVAQSGERSRKKLGSDPGGQGCEVEVELVAVHSARSLGAAWLAPGMAAPRCTFLRQERAPGGRDAGAPVCSFGVRAQWPLAPECEGQD